MSDYTLVIPAWNEADVLGRVLEELGRPAGCREVIVVDDGSTDNTVGVAQSAGATVLSHPENRGYGAALKSGILMARTEFVAVMDADGQHGAEDLLKVTQEREDSDMVVGIRTGEPVSGWLRKPGKKVLGWFVNLLLRRKIRDFNSGLRCFRTSVIRRMLHLMPDGFSFSTTSTVAMHKMGFRVCDAPVVVRGRAGRRSSVRPGRDGLKVLMLILNLAVLFEPLKIFLPAAFFFVLSSFAYFLAYAVQIRVHVTASMVMLFLTGVLLFFLGIVCEQISAIRRELGGKSEVAAAETIERF